MTNKKTTPKIEDLIEVLIHQISDHQDFIDQLMKQNATIDTKLLKLSNLEPRLDLNELKEINEQQKKLRNEIKIYIENFTATLYAHNYKVPKGYRKYYYTTLFISLLLGFSLFYNFKLKSEALQFEDDAIQMHNMIKNFIRDENLANRFDKWRSQ